jgi:quercetin dioxygenase-like cupin family protein
MPAYDTRTDRLAAPALLAMGLTMTMVPWSTDAQEQPKFVIETVAEKPLAALPEGELYWHAETFATIEEAKAAASDTAVPAEAGGKAWVLTLGPEGAAGHGGEHVATVGPLDRFDASEYLIRINVTDAPPGSKTSVHSHPGSEAIHVLSGEVTIRWPDHTDVAAAGESLTGQAPHTAMEATSTGDEQLVQLVMFVLDAKEPFSTPAALE